MGPMSKPTTSRPSHDSPPPLPRIARGHQCAGPRVGGRGVLPRRPRAGDRGHVSRGGAQGSSGARSDPLAEGQPLLACQGRARVAPLLRQANVCGRHGRLRQLPRSEARLHGRVPVLEGDSRATGGRSAPTIINRAYSLEQFWDGRAKTLEEQAKGPIANPIEMGHAHDLCEKCIGAIAGYRTRFKEVFGDEKVSIERIALSIATFERTVLSGNSPYDKFKAGDKTALSESQQRGMDIFFSNNARCDSCHEGINFTNGKYANVGIGADKPEPDLGRFAVTKQEGDRGAFKTPTLREIAHTGPYMHDGSLKTLDEVVDHYNNGGIGKSGKKPAGLHQDVRPLNLKDQDKKDLVEFLKALGGEGWQHIKPPEKLPE